MIDEIKINSNKIESSSEIDKSFASLLNKDSNQKIDEDEFEN